MSEDLIRRSDAIKAIKYTMLGALNTEERISLIMDIPTIDAVPKEDYEALQDAFNRTYNALKAIEPKRGKWIDDGFAHRCSECGEQGVGIEYFNFCPNCGADMRGTDDE